MRVLLNAIEIFLQPLKIVFFGGVGGGAKKVVVVYNVYHFVTVGFLKLKYHTDFQVSLKCR